MKRKKLFIGVLALFLAFIATAQKNERFTPSGKTNGKVFFNYVYDITDGAEQESRFEITKAYFGYDYNIAEGLKTSITLDIGKNDGGSDYSVFLKKAQLEWKASSAVKLSLGMISTIQFDDQENFWRYRYVMKSFNDQHEFGASADLGIKVSFKLSDALSANAFVINGEGYKKVQDDDGKQKVGASLICRKKSFIAKVYADVNSAKVVREGGKEDDVTVSALALFAGYNFTGKFSLAAEYNKLTNGTNYSMAAKDYNQEGVSVYSTCTLCKKWEVFGRYDYLTSNTLEGDVERWNIKSGRGITAGIQYAPVRNVRIALNHQSFNFKQKGVNTNSFLYLNFEFKF